MDHDVHKTQAFKEEMISWRERNAPSIHEHAQEFLSAAAAIGFAIMPGKAGLKKSLPHSVIRKVKIYNFKYPCKFSKEQIRTISSISETFARFTTTSLSVQLRSMVHVHVASIEQVTYEEFIHGVPTPTTLAIVNMAPLKGSAILEISSDATFAIIDRILGGTGEGTKSQHELTNIECIIMEKVISGLLENLGEAWTQVIDLKPRLVQIDTNPQFAQIVPPMEMGILIGLAVKIGDVEGWINIFYPYSIAADIMDKLLPEYWPRICRNSTSENCTVKDNITVTLTAEILTRPYSVKEIADWKTETILLSLRPLEPHHCLLKLGDRCVWQCEILPDQKWFQKQIKITGYAERPIGMEGIRMETNQKVTSALLAAGIKVTVELGSTTKTIKEIFEMGKDTILELDKQAGEPVDIKANGVLIAKGEVVVIDENFGVRIKEIDDSPFGVPKNESLEPSLDSQFQFTNCEKD